MLLEYNAIMYTLCIQLYGMTLNLHNPMEHLILVKCVHSPLQSPSSSGYFIYSLFNQQLSTVMSAP